MIVHTVNNRFIEEVLNGNEYNFLFKDLIVMDVGCNIGAFSLWIAPCARQIYAVDIAKENIDLFDKTIKENGIKNIKIYNAGISGATAIQTILEAGEPTGGGWRLGAGGTEIQTYTVKDFMEKENIDRIDILKIDTEGEERKIIGSSDFPHWRINTIIGELHLDPDTMFTSRIEIKDLLEKMGYFYQEYPNNRFVARK